MSIDRAPSRIRRKKVPFCAFDSGNRRQIVRQVSQRQNHLVSRVEIRGPSVRAGVYVSISAEISWDFH